MAIMASLPEKEAKKEESKGKKLENRQNLAGVVYAPASGSACGSVYSGTMKRSG